MRGDKLHIRTEHVLDPVHHAPLDARYICEERTALKESLVCIDPLHKGMRIERKHDKIRFSDHFRIDFRRSFVDDSLTQRVIDIGALFGDGADSESKPFQPSGVATAEQSKPNDQNFHTYVNNHIA